MAMPISVRCRTCRNYINRGTKLNSRKEAVFDDDGVKTYRFSFNCSKCSAKIVLARNPKTSITVIKSGASRNLDPDPWLSDYYEKEREKEMEEEKKLEEQEERAIALLKIILGASPNYAPKRIHDGQDLDDDADGEIGIIDLKRKKVDEETSIHNSSHPEEKSGRRRTRSSSVRFPNKVYSLRARKELKQ
ncbi:uncharacterized protein LOC132273013 [Cornus florida]|uniref:uncharacterized protein LOC132273013 n=1 Tax=Cornus florida TaxID=4283 RepID=UPI00289A486E|nr:uncharacterized protein LOC132273013 [Cornus florida]